MNKSKNMKIRSYACLIGLFVISFFLLYRYSYIYSTSDYPAHIRYALGGEGYSVVSSIIILSNWLFHSVVPFLVFMAFVIVMSVVITALYMKKILNLSGFDINIYELIPLSSTLLFLCKLCIPEWSPFFYKKDAFVTQPWHNSTYTAMRLFAMVTMCIYMNMEREYQNSIIFKRYALFTFSLLFTNLAKPNFVIVFAPVMLLMLIYDFFKTKGKSFRNAFLFGCCVLIACFVLLGQYKTLFPSEGDSGMAFSVTNAISYIFKDKKFPLYLLLNYAFSIYVTVLFAKNTKKINMAEKRFFMQICMMNIISILIYLFIVETGPRAADGNLGWGMPFFAYLLFATCLAYLRVLKEKKIITIEQYNFGRYLYYSHIIFGVFYFGTLLMGYISWRV